MGNWKGGKSVGDAPESKRHKGGEGYFQVSCGSDLTTDKQDYKIIHFLERHF